MDPSIPHHLRKIRLDTVLTSTNRSANTESNPPPAYTTYPDEQDGVHDTLSDPAGIDIEDEQDELPHEISIDATTVVSGVGNVVQLDVATRGAHLAAALASLLRDSRNGNGNGSGAPSHAPSDISDLSINNADGTFRDRPVKISLNCGVKILGQRNLIGAPSMQLVPVTATTEPKTGEGGVKRKAGPEEKLDNEPAAKCRATTADADLKERQK